MCLLGFWWCFFLVVSAGMVAGRAGYQERRDVKKKWVSGVSLRREIKKHGEARRLGTGLRDAVGCGLVGGKRRGERAGTAAAKVTKATYCGQSSRCRVHPVHPGGGDGLLRGPGGTHEGREGGWEGGRGPGGGLPGSCPRPGPRPEAASSSWLGLLGDEVAAALCPVPGDSHPPLNREQRLVGQRRKMSSCWENTKLLEPFLDKDPGFDMRARLQPLDKQARQAKLTCARCRACPVRRVHRISGPSGVSRSHQGTGTWNTSTRGRPVTQPPSGSRACPPASGRDPLPAARAQVTWGSRTNDGTLRPLLSSSCRSGLVLCSVRLVEWVPKKHVETSDLVFVLALIATTNWRSDASIRGRRVLSPSCNLIVPSQLQNN